ncbi:MAG TPA: sigma-54-dependent Fis family transcriptional regulator [Desulfobacteria bacterium]|nr:sigma-54-dependent Fis family transcriptional regulator [Desulfobacteria bacterium]
MSGKYDMVYEAWEEFQASQQISSVIMPSITKSWERCHDKNIDPFDSLAGIPVLTEEELAARKERRADFLECAGPSLDALYQFVKGSGFMVILTDEQGCVLKLLGDADIIQNTSILNFHPGSNWSEDVRGTNAIGTVIYERGPLQVCGPEHFCRSLHHLTCSAAPIFNSNNELIGIIDVTGPFRLSHPHTLGMVVSAAAAIRHQLANKVAIDETVSAYRKLNTIIESMTEGVIAVNSQGVIAHINTLAADLLNTKPDLCLGKTAGEIFDDNQVLEQAIRNKGEINGKEIVVNTTKGRVSLICSGKTYIDSKNQIGIIATISEPKRVHRLISEITGSQSQFSFKDLVGNSPEILKVINRAKMVSGNDSTVLIQGESGTGKEIFAQAIHSHSNRKREPFIAINCAAIPRALVESELFGYEDGAFTGGRKGGRPGKLELANGGTIFLDEIGDMPLEIQGSLLRFLQERTITRVGGHKAIPLDVRVIAATHKDLTTQVDLGNFRLDLYYRLNVVTIDLPSLRERKEDIIPLAENFLRRYSKLMGKTEPVISNQADLLLQNYDWPGNIRELENCIEQVMNIIEGDVLSVSLLPEALKNNFRLQSNRTNGRFLRETEGQAIMQAIQLCNGNRTKAAEYLGIGRATLYRKLKEAENPY